ncbi:MAG TPA: hypothetical protein VGZ00_07095 [Candidatus Baltobacteraceae bacterium]|nr:hypothetical protein [Candidatus Baltobacteraceae bacterium]
MAPLAALAAALLAGCGGGGPSVALPVPSPARLYAAGDAVPSNSIAYLTAPFSAASVPTGAITTASGGEVIGLAIDGSGNVIASDQFKNTIVGYARPNPTTSTLFTITPTFTPSGIAFGAQGKLYVADYTAGNIDVIAPPLSSGSAIQPLLSGFSGPSGVCIDATQTLYVTNYLPGTIRVFPPPYAQPGFTVSTGASNVDSCAVDATTNQLIVNSVGFLSGKVFVYDLPMSSASFPVTQITYSSTASTAVATDTSGRLYVGNGRPAIDVYVPPFTNTSAPIFSIPTANAITAMTFGT